MAYDKNSQEKCSGFGYSSCCSSYGLATVTNYKVASRTVKVDCHFFSMAI